MVRIPRIVAAQRLQIWLLVMALVALLVTSLLVLDLSRTRRAALIAESNRNLRNAAAELLEGAERALPGRSLARDEANALLEPVSYEILRSYLDVEGGYLWDGRIAGHSFPSYTEPGSVLYQPPFEQKLVQQALAESARTGAVALASGMEDDDLVLVAVCARPDGLYAAWALRRMINFSDTSEWRKRFVLVAAMMFALAAVLIVLRLSFSLQRGFSAMQQGLDRLRTDPAFRFPDQDRELKPIVDALNAMAESRQQLETELRREDRLRVMGRVVAGVAHEIRNPLNSIRLTIRVLERRLRGQPDTSEPVHLVIDEINRLDRILQSLSAFRADEPATVRMQPLQPVLDQTLALVKPQAEEHGVAIQLSGDTDARAPVDADLLKQSLINVLLNAIDASRRLPSSWMIADRA
jgi:signal transduction histidine kinase